MVATRQRGLTTVFGILYNACGRHHDIVHAVAIEYRLGNTVVTQVLIQKLLKNRADLTAGENRIIIIGPDSVQLTDA